MQKYNSVSLLILFFLFISDNLWAQNNPYREVSIASPTAGSLGKYADIPVSFHTGIPQISIPIYTIKEGPLNLPISISYHAGGLKVGEPASWVGAGWSLNAGGVITRTVMGIPDEKGTGTSQNQTWGYFSDYGYNNYLYSSGSQDWQRIANGDKDGEPDLFFFNFGGYSGKFYFRDDRTPVLVPQADIKIIPDYTGTGSIQSFIIVTPDGTKHYFGNIGVTTGAAPIEITNPYTSQSGLATGTAISSWYLNKISTADDEFSIKLNYVQENYGYHTLSMFPIDGYNNSDYEYNLVKNIIQGVRVNQITFTGGAVNFIGGAVRNDLSDNVSVLYDSDNQSAKALASIQVTDGGSFCKNFNLTYDYFSDNVTGLNTYLTSFGANLHTDKKRLKLQSVQELSCDSTIIIPAHIFTYFTDAVPRRLSLGLDHWGFYNGDGGNQRLIPTYTAINNGTPTIISGANRDASWPAMRGGTLKQINYPTGGHTIFDFEPNDKYYSYSQLQSVGRLTMNLGFDGNSSPKTESLTADGNPFDIILNNTTGIYDATLQVKNGSGTVVEWLVTNAGTTVQRNTTLAQGSYQVTLSFASGGNPHPSGGGALANFYQYTNVVVSGHTTVGGLRIKTMTHHDGIADTNNIITSYTYRDSSNESTGVLYSRPVYVQQVRNDLIQTVGYWNPATGFVPNSTNPNGCPVLGLYYKSGGSIRPMSTVQGNHFGYSKVKVSQAGNGYSNYNYYTTSGGFGLPGANEDVAIRTVNTSPVCEPNTPNYPAAPLPFDYKRGELNFEEHYNNAGQRLRDVFYYPQYDPASTFSTPAFTVSLRSNGVSQFLIGTSYSLSSPRRIQTQSVETIYTPGVSSLTNTNTIYFESVFHNQPTRTTATASNGNILENKTKYAFDFRVASSDAVTSCSPEYTTALASCQAQFNTTISNCGGSSTCLTNAYLAYLQCLTTARNNYVSCRRTNHTDPVNTFKTNHDNAKAGADAELKPILEMHDKYYNPAIELSQWKNNNLINASFNRFDFGLNTSTNVYPNKMMLLNPGTLSTSFSVATTISSGISITKDARYQEESVYQYKKGNPVGITRKDGIATGFIWDYHNALPIAKISNANSSTAYTSFESDGTGNWIFVFGSPSIDATAPTGKKVYELWPPNGTFNGTFIYATALDSAKTYMLSYWRKNNEGNFQVAGIADHPRKSVINKNGWTYCEHIVSGEQTVVLLSITVGKSTIDELRLYPIDAQMTTYTYDPLIALTSQCDINNKITYYEYDRFGRLKLIRDHDKNIVKAFEYRYQEQQ